jgi:endonuclease/exonuclease/phosphatase family metal-dependent hydrolase
MSMRAGPSWWLVVGSASALLAGLVGCASPDTDRGPDTFRLMTYNIRHGEGMDGRVDLERIAEVIRREGADIVALQEVDRGVARTGRRDISGELASLTGMNRVFSNNYHFQGGEYGNALLTRLPLGNWRNRHYRMLREGEQRGLLEVEFEVAGQRVVVMNTHLDFRPDDAERLSHVAEIIAAAADADSRAEAVIVCGDFNSLPGSPTHAAMKARFQDAWEAAGVGDGFTYSSVDAVRRIDYIFHSSGSGLTPVRAWVSPSLASDHLPLTVEFRWNGVREGQKD